MEEQRDYQGDGLQPQFGEGEQHSGSKNVHDETVTLLQRYSEFGLEYNEIDMSSRLKKNAQHRPRRSDPTSDHFERSRSRDSPNRSSKATSPTGRRGPARSSPGDKNSKMSETHLALLTQSPRRSTKINSEPYKSKQSQLSSYYAS